MKSVDQMEITNAEMLSTKYDEQFDFRTYRVADKFCLSISMIATVSVAS
jgi:hypothetical protein